jgi:DNA-binding NarL/FixJ family response regulator
MKFLIVDDHSLIRDGMRLALESLDGAAIILEAKNASEAFALLEQHHDLDLVLLDLGLPGMDGLTALQELHRRDSTVPVVILSGSGDRSDVIAGLNMGAVGFIPKSSTREVMLQALRLVLAGGVYIPPQALGSSDARAETGTKSASDLGLTDRQAQILGLIAQGKPNKVIARELNIADATVKAHVTEILRALQVKNRTQAVIAARRVDTR